MVTTDRKIAVKYTKALVFDNGLAMKDLDIDGDYRVLYVGICGTDIAIMKGSYKPRKLPIVLGHEFSLEVDGKVYTSEINVVDWTCNYCKRGEYTHCENRKAIGIDLDGAMRERISVPKYMLHRGRSPLASSLAEPTAAVLRMVELLRPSPEDTALVIGDGPVAIISSLVLSREGLEVKLKGKHRERMKVAASMGVNVTDEAEGKYDIVVEATGGSALNEAVRYVKPMGKVAVKSTHGLDVPLDQTKVAVDEISIIGSRCGPFYLWDKAVRYTEELGLEQMVKVYSFRDYAQAFMDVMERKVVKAVLDLSQG